MKSQSILLLASVALVLALVNANENPSKTILNDGSKVKIEDNSRVLTDEEIAKLDKDKIPVVVPLVRDPAKPVIMPKIGVVVQNSEPMGESAKAAVDQKAADVNSEVKLPPIPLIMPSFLNSVFDQPAVDDSVPASDPASPSTDEKPNGIF